MTIFETMKERALAEFDRLARESEQRIRDVLTAEGKSPAEIDAVIQKALPDVKAQRATASSIVTIALLKSGIPISKGGDDNVSS